MMESLSVKLLSALSIPPARIKTTSSHPQYTKANALDLLSREFPDLRDRVAGRRVMEYGCGAGFQSVALHQLGAAFVLGVDAHPAAVESGTKLAVAEGVEQYVRFSQKAEGTFDVVVSQNAMEHFPEPEKSLREMAAVLSPSGAILITFGPPWFAPYGSHMHFFTKVPWVNILFSERTVLAVRAKYKADDARRYEDIEQGMNRMTVAKFERLVAAAGLKFETKVLRTVKNLPIVGSCAGIRELLVNQVTAVLKPAGARTS